jgi:putative aminopeptidase FrvX
MFLKENTMLLKHLSNLDGTSGDEREVRDFIKKNIKNHVDSMETDHLGNLICFKKGTQRKPTVLLAAHMDEVGFMITEKKKDGTLKFSRVGGIDTRVMLSKTLRIGKNKVKGVIGIKPVHLMEDEEYNKIPKFKDLYIDVGAQSSKEIKDIEIGDFAYFDTTCEKTSPGIVKGKAFDDRIGCSLIMELVKKKFNNPLYAVFSVQEEIGLRGATVIGNRLNPDYALILEGTGAGDFPIEKDLSRDPQLGKGPTLTVMDRSMIADRDLLQMIIKIAERESIPYQIKQPGIGGTDAGRIQISQKGVPCSVIAVPARYIHSPVSLMSIKDYKNSFKLIHSVLKYLGKMEGK